jgi:hypothetical protein
MVILNIVQPFGKIYGNWVYFVVIWYVFPLFWYIVPRKIRYHWT